MTAYYNEIDPKAAATLRELIRAGVIAPGDVDERSIADVAPGDLVGFRQCHFFAGGGVWSYALRLAGWSDDREVWTGSCPCQPFSVAGRQRGTKDERHLWPELRRLIRERGPAVVLGEQVASPAGRTWLHDVRADLEDMGYAVGGADLCAAGIGAPHIRQRLYWVADASRARVRDQGCRPDALSTRGSESEGLQRQRLRDVAGDDDDGRALGLAHGIGAGLEGHGRHGDHGYEPGRLGALEIGPVAAGGAVGGVADSEHAQRRPELQGDGDAYGRDGSGRRGDDGDPGPVNGHWRAADWLFCRDGKWRPVEPGTFPLAHGAPARVGRLRLYGNAIVAQVAQEFIEAYLDVIQLSVPRQMHGQK